MGPLVATVPQRQSHSITTITIQKEESTVVSKPQRHQNNILHGSTTQKTALNGKQQNFVSVSGRSIYGMNV
jgi:hypothetical protein